jgi:FkbM family methyltransferase
MSRLVRRGDLVFDVGAHTGATAGAFLAEGARVVCVEPQPQCVTELRRRFGASGRLSIVPVGLGAHEGRLTLSICSSSTVLSTFKDDWKQGRFAEHIWDQQLEVAISTLDRLIEQHGMPRYCKIDVEGFELEVLKGLSQPIPFVSIEYAVEFRAATEQCVRRLEALRFQRFNASRADTERLALSEWCSPAHLLEWLAAEADPLAWGDIYASADDRPNVTTLPGRRPGIVRRAWRRLADLS